MNNSSEYQKKIMNFIRKGVNLLPDGYYLKHLAVALILCLVILSEKHDLSAFLLSIPSTLLYPYSIYVINNTLDLFGKNYDEIIHIILKTLCAFVGAILIAPIGVSYLIIKKKLSIQEESY